jgi:hypothetical protein
MAFIPNLRTLPEPQRTLWLELGATPDIFTLYEGTALALHLGHRCSVDSISSPTPASTRID